MRAGSRRARHGRVRGMPGAHPGSGHPRTSRRSARLRDHAVRVLPQQLECSRRSRALTAVRLVRHQRAYRIGRYLSSSHCESWRAVVLPLLALDLDEAREHVLAERLQDQLRLRRDLDRLAERLGELLDARAACARPARGGRGCAPSARGARSPSRSPRGPPAGAPRSTGRGCRTGRGCGSRSASPAPCRGGRAARGSAPSGCGATRRRRPAPRSRARAACRS